MTASDTSWVSPAGSTRSGCEIRAAGRVLAVTSVDGVNVITGKTASPLGSGYVLDPWAVVDIDGWRKSMDQVAAFYFTALPDSYAARTGRPDDVGVIGVALFSERQPIPLASREYASPSAPQPAAEAAAERKSSRAEDGLARQDERLGTGHGRRLDSGATYTSFDRASDEPDEVIRIYYDSRRNLVARGIIPPAARSLRPSCLPSRSPTARPRPLIDPITTEVTRTCGCGHRQREGSGRAQ
jgi:hypothetical protein